MGQSAIFDPKHGRLVVLRPRPYFINVKIILNLKYKINLIFYLIKEFMKHSCLNFFYEIVNKISIIKFRGTET